MSNRDEMRTRVRLELDDAGEVRTWPDELLDEWLVEAAEWFSQIEPYETTALRDVSTGQRIFSRPPGALRVVGVECPPGNIVPKEGEVTLGDPTTYEGARRLSWSEWGGSIYMSRPLTDNGEVGASRLQMRLQLPWDRPDPVEQWNGPASAERPLVLWVCREAWGWLDGRDQKRGRVNRQGAMSTNSTLGSYALYQRLLDDAIAARRKVRSFTARQLEG